MLDVRKSFVIVGCVAVGFVLSAGPGLVARAAEPERWVGALAADASKSAASEQAAQRHVMELERRVQELEAERSAAAKGGARELAAALARTEALEASNHALALENQELVRGRAARAQDASCGLAGEGEPREQLRYWARRMRDGDTGFRGRMSSEWNAALNVLLRRERPLDTRNPWREPETEASPSQR